MSNILIFTRNCLPLSATFIYRQIQGSTNHFKVFLAASKFLNLDKFLVSGVQQKIELKGYVNILDKLLTILSRRIFKSGKRISLLNSLRLKQFLIENKINIVHVHYGDWAVELLPIVRKLNLPLIVSFHGYDASKALRNIRYRSKLNELFEYAERIIIVSEHMNFSLGLEHFGNKVSLIPYGVDTEKFSALDGGATDSEIKILHSGRIVAKKGVPDLVHVFVELSRRYGNLTLHILGDGDELVECQSIVREAGVSDRVQFYGAQPEETVIQLMRECDVFVLNSRTADDGDMEGLPNSILEAMSIGMAVVSTYHAGIPVAIENNISGILVPERDNESLKRALETLIMDRRLIGTLGSNASERAKKYFRIDQMQHKINSIYLNVCGEVV